ncbi:MAG: hypothetical protein ACUVT1_10830, partial [Anaerolineae bacterium]
MGDERPPAVRRHIVLLILLAVVGTLLGACGADAPRAMPPPAAATTALAPAVSTPPPTATWVPLPTETPATPTKPPVAPVPGALAPDFVVSDPEG